MTTDQTYRIVCTGSRGLVAAGLEECLSGHGHVLTNAGARRIPVLATIERERPDIVLAGPTRPGYRSFTLARAVVEQWPELPILLLARRADDELVVADAAYVGVCGCLDVNVECRELLEAIRSATAGRLLFTAEQMQLARSVEPLTARQTEILRLAADGHSTSEIARKSGISVNTARNHLAEIRSRLGVHTTRDAVHRSHRRGWLDPE